MRTKKQTLLIIRGLPGSGKSTYAKKKRGYLHYETDIFFVDRKTGVYNFDPRKLGYAHQWCLDSTKKALLAGEDVIVSNTFTTVREMLPYLDLAHELKIQVKVVHCTGEFKSEHGVPDSTLQKMKDRWEKYKGERVYCPKASRTEEGDMKKTTILEVIGNVDPTSSKNKKWVVVRNDFDPESVGTSTACGVPCRAEDVPAGTKYTCVLTVPKAKHP